MMLDSLMLYLEQGTVSNSELEMIAKKARQNYVDTRHSASIFQMTNAAGSRKDKWKTFYYADGKRKEIVRSTKDEIYEELFKIYSSNDAKRKKLKEVLEELAFYKTEYLNRSNHTVLVDRRRFELLSRELKEMIISEITKEDIQKWIMKEYLPMKPKEDALRKMFQLMSQLFEFGIEQEYCTKNPMKFMSVNNYLSKCDHRKKKNEEKQFSREELDRLYEAAFSKRDNPRAVMMMVAMETGLRGGELAALHKEDIGESYIHVHRQQVRAIDDEGHEFIHEVTYTKDERTNPHDGRLVPITEKCREALLLAEKLPGESEYLFHDKEGDPIHKDTYNKYLSRRCKEVNAGATNNHAFRNAFNYRMIELDLNSAERALIMGQSVQTNERYYAHSDKRRLEGIKERLCTV